MKSSRLLKIKRKKEKNCENGRRYILHFACFCGTIKIRGCQRRAADFAEKAFLVLPKMIEKT